MITGTLIKTDDDAFVGYIATLTFDVDVTFTENPFKQADAHPDFAINGKSPRGREIRIGSAWERISRKGNAYLSIVVNVNGTNLRANAIQRENNEAGETVFEIAAWV